MPRKAPVVAAWVFALATLAGINPLDALEMRVIDVLARVRRRMSQ